MLLYQKKRSLSVTYKRIISFCEKELWLSGGSVHADQAATSGSTEGSQCESVIHRLYSPTEGQTSVCKNKSDDIEVYKKMSLPTQCPVPQYPNNVLLVNYSLFRIKQTKKLSMLLRRLTLIDRSLPPPDPYTSSLRHSPHSNYAQFCLLVAKKQKGNGEDCIFLCFQPEELCVPMRKQILPEA